MAEKHQRQLQLPVSYLSTSAKERLFLDSHLHLLLAESLNAWALHYRRQLKLCVVCKLQLNCVRSSPMWKRNDESYPALDEKASRLSRAERTKGQKVLLWVLMGTDGSQGQGLGPTSQSWGPTDEQTGRQASGWADGREGSQAVPNNGGKQGWAPVVQE